MELSILIMDYDILFIRMKYLEILYIYEKL